MAHIYRIGYLDEDINQVGIYQRRLRDYGIEVIGYEITKGMTLDSLMEQIYSSGIELLMIDFKLTDGNIIQFNGDKVERHIYKHRPLFPHIVFTGNENEAIHQVDDLKIVFGKNEIMDEDEEKNKKFVDTLTKSIDQYRFYIKEKTDTIESLSTKKEASGIDATERNALLSAQRDLRTIGYASDEIPEQLLQPNSAEEITSLRREAEEFLKTLQ